MQPKKRIAIQLAGSLFNESELMTVYTRCFKITGLITGNLLEIEAGLDINKSESTRVCRL
jgi:hypothetical protein